MKTETGSSVDREVATSVGDGPVDYRHRPRPVHTRQGPPRTTTHVSGGVRGYIRSNPYDVGNHMSLRLSGLSNLLNRFSSVSLVYRLSPDLKARRVPRTG